MAGFQRFEKLRDKVYNFFEWGILSEDDENEIYDFIDPYQGKLEFLFGNEKVKIKRLPHEIR